MVNKQVEEEIGFYEQQAEIVSYIYYNSTWTDWSTIKEVIMQVISKLDKHKERATSARLFPELYTT